MITYQFGQQDFRPVRTLSATVIAKGDLLYLDTGTGTAKPANSFTWTTDLATTRANFAAVFLGIAASGKAAGSTDDVTVDLSPLSVFAANCILHTFEIGDMVTPAQDGSNNLLSSNAVERTTTAAQAIGRVHRYVAHADALVKVHFGSAYAAGSSNKNSFFGL